VVETGATAPSEKAMVGLYFIQQYRFLTITQFAKASGLKYATAAEMLLRFERQRLLGHFGNTGIRGYGKTPKVYFLKERGYRMLVEESGIPVELIGDYKTVHVTVKWSPVMYHRMATLDLLIALEVGVREKPRLELVRTFIEYRRTKRDGELVNETTDYVTGKAGAGTRIVPDAGFVLRNVEEDECALFFIETDMGTERIVSAVAQGARLSLAHKMSQYDRYLQSGRFADTYKEWGKFSFFTVLFVTTTDERIANIRRGMEKLSNKLHDYYRFNTFEAASERFFNDGWVSRSADDEKTYPIAN